MSNSCIFSHDPHLSSTVILCFIQSSKKVLTVFFTCSSFDCNSPSSSLTHCSVCDSLTILNRLEITLFFPLPVGSLNAWSLSFFALLILSLCSLSLAFFSCFITALIWSLYLCFNLFLPSFVSLPVLLSLSTTRPSGTSCLHTALFSALSITSLFFDPVIALIAPLILFTHVSNFSPYPSLCIVVRVLLGYCRLTSSAMVPIAASLIAFIRNSPSSSRE